MENEQSVISSLFTEEELNELKFTPEEISAIEDVELSSRLLENLPDSDKDMDKLFARISQEFPKGKSMDETFNHYVELSKSDPKFIAQVVALSAILDDVKNVPPAKTEKISLDEINKIKNDEKFEQINQVLKNMK